MNQDPNMNNAPVTEPETQPVTVPDTTPVEQPLTQEQKKSAILPIIIIVVVLCLAAFLIFTFVTVGKKNEPKKENEITEKEETKVKGKVKEEEKEKKEDKEEKEEETKKEETKETPKPQESTAPSNNEDHISGTEEINFGLGTDPTTGEIDMGSGAVFYIYEGSSIGVDDTDFKYVSHTSSQLVVDVTVKGNTQTVTFPLGQPVKVNGIKNQIIAEYSAEDDGFKLNFQ